MSAEEENDVTVLRADTSVSISVTGRSGSGEADAPRVLKQRFVLEEKLGSGGMGSVFRAKDLRKVEARDRQPFLAIKVLNNDFREHPEAFVALQREAVKSQSVSHPNIVSIYDFDKDGDLPFMTMELLEGQELTDLIRAYAAGMPDEMAWKVIRGVCAGLRHAHEAGIVHADFKPGNVFVSPHNSAKILDFGIARAVQLTEAVGEDTVFDPARLAALTPAYASREMLAGANPEPRDDIYSLGIVIYLILTGSHPYGRRSAEEAAREGLVPQKPKRLGYRQWRILRQCLAFDREDRPDNMAKVETVLFQPSPWRSRSVLAAAAAFTLAMGLSFLVDDAELTEVKHEVRQHTLIDAQVARISALLEVPQFDDNWQSQLEQELETLRGISDSAAVEAALLERIRERFTTKIQAADDLASALALFQRGSGFGELPQAQRWIDALGLARLQELISIAELDPAWLETLQTELAQVRTLVHHNPQLAAVEQQLADVLVMLLREASSAASLDAANVALAQLDELEFDLDTLQRTGAVVARAAQAKASASKARRVEQRQQNYEQALDKLLASSCLRLDLEQVQQTIEHMPTQRASAMDAVDQRVGECLSQLAQLDPDRAQQLQRQARQRFGNSLQATSQNLVDPCGLSYLVGNGAQGGRRGYCADDLADGTQGPRLVVVPTAEGPGRYAITKQEVTWSDFSAFCEDTGHCDANVAEPRLPVTQVSIDLAREFAAWLTRRSGFTYRLPTVQEWQWAAKGQPDPNRNCRVQLNGFQRGLGPVAANSGQSNEYGLLNMLGNVQEWVVDAGGIRAVGGAFSDPIQECVAQTARGHGGEADQSTGFRLVREIS